MNRLKFIFNCYGSAFPKEPLIDRNPCVGRNGIQLGEYLSLDPMSYCRENAVDPTACTLFACYRLKSPVNNGGSVTDLDCFLVAAFNRAA